MKPVRLYSRIILAVFSMAMPGLAAEKTELSLKEEQHTPQRRVIQDNDDKPCESAQGISSTPADVTSVLESLIHKNKDFSCLLLYISLLDSRYIPVAILEPCATGSSIANLLYHLENHSWITYDLYLQDTAAAFSLSHDTQQIILTYLVNALNLKNDEIVLQKIVNVFEGHMVKANEDENFDVMKVLSTHCQKFLTHQELLAENMVNALKGELGEMHHYAGNYKTSLELLEETYEYYEKENNKDFARIARVAYYLGEIYKSLGFYEKGIKSFEQSINPYKTYFPHDHQKVAQATSNLANLYRTLGQYTKANDLLNECLAIYKQKLPTDYINISWIYLFQGYTHEGLGNYKQAKENFKQSLNTCQNHLPGHPVKLAWSLANIGNMLREEGNYKEAEELINHSLRLCHENLPENHKGYATALAYSGILAKNLGHYEKAKEIFKRSIAPFEKVVIENSIGAAWIKSEMGIVERDLGNYNEASLLFRESLAVYTKIYGKDHVETADLLKEIGVLYCLQENFEEAERLLRQSLNILKHNGHSHCYLSLEYLADLYRKKSIKAKEEGAIYHSENIEIQAMIYLKQALSMLEAHFAGDSPHWQRIEAKITGMKA